MDLTEAKDAKRLRTEGEGRGVAGEGDRMRKEGCGGGGEGERVRREKGQMERICGEKKKGKRS